MLLEDIIKHEGGDKAIVTILGDINEPKEIALFAAMTLSRVTPHSAPIDEILQLLRSDEAHIRTSAISILQDYGDSIKHHVEKFLHDDERDVRIFAVNVLGDVQFEESRTLLLDLIKTEHDVNVAMTAVDYLAEIGQPEDVEILKKLEARFPGEAYVSFAINNAISMIEG
jgi:HEAT repeat protein